MNGAQRLAGAVWQKYKGSPELTKNVVETLVMTVGLTGATALLTEMSPEELAVQASVGAAAGFAGRPLGAAAGARMGRAIEGLSGRSPEQLVAHKNRIKPMWDEAFAKGGTAGSELGSYVWDRNFHTGGVFEGAARAAGREGGDNVLQAASMAAIPAVSGMLNQPEEQADY